MDLSPGSMTEPRRPRAGRITRICAEEEAGSAATDIPRSYREGSRNSLRQAVVQGIAVLTVGDLDLEGAADSVKVAGAGAGHDLDGPTFAGRVHADNMLHGERAVFTFQRAGVLFHGDGPGRALFGIAC